MFVELCRVWCASIVAECGLSRFGHHEGTIGRAEQDERGNALHTLCVGSSCIGIVKHLNRCTALGVTKRPDGLTDRPHYERR